MILMLMCTDVYGGRTGKELQALLDTGEDNWIIAMGGLIHAGVPMGGEAWHPRLGGTVLFGASVRDNLVSGKAGGYGYVANGIDGFIIKGNRSEAVYSGIGDGLPGNPPDEGSAFLYNPGAIGSSELQPDFVAAKSHVNKVLRSDRGKGVPADPLGYRDLGYPEMEAEAVIEGAFMEMLGRIPSEAEMRHWVCWLCTAHVNADTLRRQLMGTPEFAARFGYVNPLELHQWRSSRWLEMILSACRKLQADNAGKWPDARDMHNHLMDSLSR